MRITLPFPSPQLSPNSRVHWAVKSSAATLARKAAWALTKEAMGKSGIANGSMAGPIAVLLTFYPPTGRIYDLDNLLSRSKSALDGIADALCLNDNLFRPVPEFGPVMKGGCLVVTLTPALVEIPLRGVVT